MPVTDKALKAIPEGHTTRPFLIVKKGKGQLYGYACATHPKQLRSYEKHVLANEVYDSKNARYKDSVVQFDCAYVIPIAHIQYIYKELDEYCVRQIARELKAYANIRGKAILNFDMEIPIHKGDIFKIDKSYYYFNEKDTFNKLGYKTKINTHTTSCINLFLDIYLYSEYRLIYC